METSKRWLTEIYRYDAPFFGPRERIPDAELGDK